MPRTRIAYIAVACALVMPSGAAAQSARPDPDSPAGVEYELPLDQARKDLSGDGDSDSPGANGSRASDGRSGTAPLFGAGVSRPSRSSDSDGGSPEGGGGSSDGAPSSGSDRWGIGGDRADAGARGTASGDDAAAPDGSRLASTGSSGGSGSAGLPIAGIALGVLFAGGALGLALRRGFGQSQDP